MPPHSRGVLDRLYVQISVVRLGITNSVLFHDIELNLPYLYFILDCNFCMLVIRLMRLVWRFSISPFAGNFLALVPGRYKVGIKARFKCPRVSNVPRQVESCPWVCCAPYLRVGGYETLRKASLHFIINRAK